MEDRFAELAQSLNCARCEAASTDVCTHRLRALDFRSEGHEPRTPSEIQGQLITLRDNWREFTLTGPLQRRLLPEV